jgi:hypothetical protein
MPTNASFADKHKHAQLANRIVLMLSGIGGSIIQPSVFICIFVEDKGRL